MTFTYKWRDYLRHQKAWQSHYHTLTIIPSSIPGGHPTEVGADHSTMAEALRIRHMMISEGVNPSEEGKTGKVFFLTQLFLANHLNVLFKSGLVRMDDGKQAVVAPVLAVAMHQAFVGDPPPEFLSVSVDAVIDAAKNKYFSWINPPMNN